MRNKPIPLAVTIIVGLALIGLIFALNRPSKTNTAQQPAPAVTEQNNEPEATPEEEIPMELDINTQEFTLTGSNVSCSTTTVNGRTTHNCTGSIYIVPSSNQEHEPGMYKINEQTRLLRGEEQQDIQTLQQLASNQTNVRLKMADNSSDTLAEIRY